MKRVRWLIGFYLLAAVLTRTAEGFGATRCHCGDDCWCKRPGLSAFRWVFPYRHRDASP